MEAPREREAPLPASAAEALAVVVFALVCVGFHVFSGWVPILDSANLALHEAGHPLLGIFSARASVYGGTVFQLLFPLAAVHHFRREGRAAGIAAAGVWLAENLFNIARYMADARRQALPLVGGGEHDWTEIFTRWGMLAADGRIAALTRALGVAIMLAALARLLRRRPAR